MNNVPGPEPPFWWGVLYGLIILLPFWMWIAWLLWG